MGVRSTPRGVLAVLMILASGVSGAAGPISVGAVYTADALSNIGNGGLSDGERVLQNLFVSAELPFAQEGERAYSRVYLSVLHNTGERFSGDVIGDAQFVSNIEANRATRVFEFFYESGSTDDRSSWLAGFWDLNSEIDVVEPAGLFLNGSHGIGATFGTSGKNGPSIFPVTSLALRWRYRVNDRVTFRAAVLDGVPGNPAAPGRSISTQPERFSLSSDDGALLVGELDYALHPRWNGKLGLWHYTAKEETFLEPQDKAFAQGAYASLYGALHEQPGGGGKLEAFTRVGVANGDVQQIAGYLGAGLVYSGFGAPAANAQFGLATATAFSGRESRSLKADKHETSVELTFSANIAPWLRLQPNLQYVINPGLDPTLNSTLVLGLRMEITGALDF